MKQLFEKWFCKHVWKIHVTKKWISSIDYDAFGDRAVRRTKEILICEKCGKIKRITY